MNGQGFRDQREDPNEDTVAEAVPRKASYSEESECHALEHWKSSERSVPVWLRSSGSELRCCDRWNRLMRLEGQQVLQSHQSSVDVERLQAEGRRLYGWSHFLRPMKCITSRPALPQSPAVP